jgi:hypothetical protein
MKYYKIMLIPILCFTFSASNAEESNSIKIKRGKINNVVSKYFKKIGTFEEEKEPDKDTEVVCGKCNGKKFIIQGDGHKTPCPFCATTGQSAPESIEEKKGTIYFYNVSTCDSCNTWKNKEGQLIKDFDIVEVDETTSLTKKFKNYPSYEIKFKNKNVQFTGYLTQNTLGQLYDKYSK